MTAVLFILGRAKHIKASPRACVNEYKQKKRGGPSPTKDQSCERILNKVRLFYISQNFLRKLYNLVYKQSFSFV